MSRPKLTDILGSQSERESLKRAWAETDAAKDFEVLPAGDYVAEVIGGELFKAQTGTLAYKVTFRVVEGDHARRLLWSDIWLTQAALSMAKRNLGKLGIKKDEQLERPVPPGIICKVHVVVRKSDEGAERNHVRSFDVVRIEPPAPNPFAPPPVASEPRVDEEDTV